DVLSHGDAISHSGDNTGDMCGAPFVYQTNNITFNPETNKILFHFKAVYQKMELRAAAGCVLC
ncbi:hypothetical protein, partial [Klebsiella michiganensis]|uniref:hypothetical protein n=1 Tax=Klebsiella michiganensis TaxID=1134687 RepID=UPI001CCEE5CC